MGIIITTTANQYHVDFNGVQNPANDTKLARRKEQCKFNLRDGYIRVEIFGERSVWDITNDSTSTDYLVVESVNGTPVDLPATLSDLYDILIAAQG